MIQGLDGELHERGMELGPYLAHLKKTQEDLRREWHSKAEEQIKIGLIVKAIGKEEHLEVSENEIKEELELTLQQYITRGGANGEPAEPEILQNIDPEQMRNKIYEGLLSEKVLEFLENQTQFT